MRIEGKIVKMACPTCHRVLTLVDAHGESPVKIICPCGQEVVLSNGEDTIYIGFKL